VHGAGTVGALELGYLEHPHHPTSLHSELAPSMDQRAHAAPNTRNAVQQSAIWTPKTEQRKHMLSDVASFILAVGVLASAAKQPRTKLPWIIVATLLARGVAAQQSLGCPVGKYESGNTCILCPAGLYNANPGSTECSACLPGTFSHGGSSVCEDCVAGQTDHDGSATTPCQPCPAHSYGSSSGSFSVTK
jgi:hypothetical protein